MQAQDLQKHKGSDRIIIISSPEFGDKKAEEQVALLRSQKDELKDRKLIVYQVTNHGYVENFGWGIEPSVRTQSKIDGFYVTLIGLDGTEKFSSENVEQPATFFNLVDSMPMRKEELRENE
ncbi:DUF4174 domain-containing protein [Cochleicola gelatinilyticus]|uniref:DUF4174 domain-containing protein n=1 Tax=Cochleicola gelatinilyticus TaxID=1763537 RepID=A0A167INQ5_9FLAO|nr:DUF4174 domain-containing protein [Cochleicola gelatinilyticus]OAB79860.1 hypothetical protein ULVI_03730 [Cochleicola gelatinilyticus]